MRTNRDIILSYLRELNRKNLENYQGISANELAELLHMQRSNVSSILNQLVSDKLVEKSATRPVRFRLYLSSSSKETSSLSGLIGADGSLKNAIQLAKAATLYPERPLPILLTGTAGSGKSYFISLLYEFAMENAVIPKESSIKTINCKRYINQEDAFYDKLMQYKGQNVVLENLDFLSSGVQAALFEDDGNQHHRNIMICSQTNSNGVLLQEELLKHFPVRIHLPALADRGLKERLELVQHFLNDQANKTGRKIKLNSELLYCLMLYHPEGEVRQLKSDIQIGCANAYVREHHASTIELHLFIHDFPAYVRRGFLQWKNHQSTLSQLIPSECSFCYTGLSVEQWSNQLEDKSNTAKNIYELIEEEEMQLKARGLTEESISAIISANLMNKLNTTTQLQENFSRDNLTKLVDEPLIKLVEQFLDSVRETLGQAISVSTFYGLCLHLSASLQRSVKTQRLPNEKLIEIMENHGEEYRLSLAFIQEIERTYDVRVPIDEVVIVTMFLLKDNSGGIAGDEPVLLIAMHGAGTASSVAAVANSLSMTHNAHAFDLPLELDMDEAYRRFTEYVQAIHKGSGILLIYDMGSVKTMAELVMQETGISIRCIEIPVTLIALECTRKINGFSNVDAVYKEIAQSCQESFSFVKENYQHLSSSQVIITLCMTGQGGAIQIKNYLEKNADTSNIDIIALSTSDHNILIQEINRILKQHEIVCIIGTFDPKMYGIPFISIAKLFETPTDKLSLLLAMDDSDIAKDIDYDRVYDYITEQLPAVDIKKLKQHLPHVLSAIKKAAGGLSEAQEMGLFMHLACAINRLLVGETIQDTRNSNKIISANKRWYHNLQDILAAIESAFQIKFRDEEIASIITIIKQGKV